MRLGTYPEMLRHASGFIGSYIVSATASAAQGFKTHHTKRPCLQPTLHLDLAINLLESIML
jgi:hypothetical protein